MFKNNKHKSAMCGVCLKVVCDDKLKRHMSAENGNTESVELDNDPTEAFDQY